jgi:hypothetical protein
MMPRPINYINKLKHWARKTDGDEGMRLALINTLNLFLESSVKIEEVNKMVDKYSKTIKPAKVLADVDEIENYLSVAESYLEGLDN